MGSLVFSCSGSRAWSGGGDGDQQASSRLMGTNREQRRGTWLTERATTDAIIPASCRFSATGQRRHCHCQTCVCVYGPHQKAHACVSLKLMKQDRAEVDYRMNSQFLGNTCLSSSATRACVFTYVRMHIKCVQVCMRPQPT